MCIRDRVATDAAAEAVVQLLRGVDRERRRALLVERAATAVVGAGLAQLGVLADDLDHVGGGLDLIDAGAGDERHLRGRPSCPRAAPSPALRDTACRC